LFFSRPGCNPRRYPVADRVASSVIKGAVSGERSAREGGNEPPVAVMMMNEEPTNDLSGLSGLQSDLTRAVGDYHRLTEQLIQWADTLLEHASTGAREEAARGEPSVIGINNACQRYVQCLASMEEIVGHAEKHVRTSQHSMKLERGRKHLENVGQAVESVMQCVQRASVLTQLHDAVRDGGASPVQASEVMEVFSALSQETLPRVRDVTRGCRGVLSATMRQYLEECSWPPPLLPSATNSTTCLESDPWKGFEDAGDTVFGELQETIVQMLALQGATDPGTFSGHLGDMYTREAQLWPAIEFSRPVNAWIASHFAPDMPTCKIERPEWLFTAVLHAVRACTDYVDVFEPCIEAQGIQQFFSMPVEVAICVYKRGVCGVVKGVYVPLLFVERDPAYLLHFVDEAIKFEDEFLPLRTDPVQYVANQGTGSGPRDGCMLLDILFSDDQWLSHWLLCEQEEARHRIWNDMNGSDSDYDPIPRMVGDSEATRHVPLFDEFRPSLALLDAVETLVDLLNRTTYMSVVDNKRHWCHSVVSTAIETIKGHLQSEISRVQQFDHLTDDIGVPVASGCLNDLRFLEHTLAEPMGPLMEVVSSDPELFLPFFEQQANDLGMLRRKWTNTILESAMAAVLSNFTTDVDVSISQISRLLDEFSKYMDEVGFHTLWKAVAATLDHAWVGSLDAAGASWDDLHRLMRVFEVYTMKPRAYFRNSCAAMGCI